MADLSIRKILTQVQSGQIRIPAFQRGFVWDADRVAYLMDSIYKGYPFGAIILWRTRETLQVERKLGPFDLGKADPDFPVDYVLDGQQRLTSIFGVFQSDISPDHHEDMSWTQIYYDFEAEKDLQESQFLALSDAEFDASRHFPIGKFFDVQGYRIATEGLSEERLEEIDQVQSVFKEAIVPVQMIETDDRSKVAIVFERVNRLGVDLDVFQLLSAWTWSEEFDLQEKFADLSEELKPFGFEAVGDDSNLLLRCCSAIIGGDSTPSGLLALNGAEVRARFDEITNGIKGAVDFLRNNLHVRKLDNLPYPTLIVPLAVYFSAKDGKSVALSATQRSELARWFWRSCYSRRFSAGVLRNLNRDVSEALRLKQDGTRGLADFSWSIAPEFFLENRFTITSVATKTHILILAQAGPKSFISGGPVTLDEVLGQYNRKEFHHLFPKSHLATNGHGSNSINRLANFAIISSIDNKKLGGVAPSEYREKMPADQIQEILDSALTPATLFTTEFDTFASERSKILANFAKELAT